MLRKSLQHICSSSEIEEALRNINLPATVRKKRKSNKNRFLVFTIFPYSLELFMQSRPEELTIEDFVNLHGVIVKNSMFAYDGLED